MRGETYRKMRVAVFDGLRLEKKFQENLVGK